MFVLLAGDVALIVGQDGVIQNVAVGANIVDTSASAWVGRHWADTVTGDTRRKIELLMQEVDSAGVTRRREVNHHSSDGAGIPVSYAALRLGIQGPVIAVGRDLRTVAAIQQQMIKSQQEMERDYWALRRDQDQQRELEQVASDAVLLVTGPDLEVAKFNEAAGLMLMQADGTICDQLLTLLTHVLESGKPMAVRARLKFKGPDSPLLDLFVTPLNDRESGTVERRLLVRARRVGRQEIMPADMRTVITDTQGRILMASDALMAMCADADSNGLYGKSLISVLDSEQGVLAGLLQMVQREGMAHIPSAIVGGRSAPVCEAELSATLIFEGDKERIGFCLKVHAAENADAWTQTLESLLASRQPLTEMLHAVQNLTERRAISNALRSTGANMLASAKLLGISLEDLTQRLDRLGLDRAQYTAH